MVMDKTVEKISIDLLDLFDKPQYIAIDKCHTGTVQARQRGTEIREDDKLVDSIRRVGGIMHPVILQDLKNGESKRMKKPATPPNVPIKARPP